MDPLPPMHRLGIIIAAIVLIIGILLPGDETRQMPVVTREAQLDMQSPPGEAQLQAHLVTPQNDPDQVAWSRRNLFRKVNLKSHLLQRHNLSNRKVVSINSGGHIA